MAKYTKLDNYDGRMVFADYQLQFVDLDDLSEADVVAITGGFVSNDNRIYIDSHRAIVDDFTTRLSKTFYGRHAMRLCVTEIF